MVISLYAGILTLIYFKITIDTIKSRRKNQISLGSGKDNQILKFTSAHSNFNQYSVLFIVLTYFVESASFLPGIVIHIIALTFTAGRIFHYLGMTASEMDFSKRKFGMHLSLWPLLILSVLNILAFVRQFFAGV